MFYLFSMYILAHIREDHAFDHSRHETLVTVLHEVSLLSSSRQELYKASYFKYWMAGAFSRFTRGHFKT